MFVNRQYTCFVAMQLYALLVIMIILVLCGIHALAATQGLNTPVVFDQISVFTDIYSGNQD